MPAHIPPVPQLAALASRISEPEFVRFFPGVYLVTARIGDSARERIFATSQVSTRRSESARDVLAVRAIEKREEMNPYGSMITIGRARNNDIVLDELSVSKLHCWIRRHENVAEAAVTDTGVANPGAAERGVDRPARLTITDAGSRNGTAIDGVPITGEPRTINLGANLRIGSVELWIADGKMLHQSLRAADIRTRAA